MKCIVGLGNPGDQYRDTRHNIGFWVVEKLGRELVTGEPHWSYDKRAQAEVAKINDVLLVKPQTFMNASGEAVSQLSSYYKYTTSDVWVVHDDIDLPIGKLRIRFGGASGGHNGVGSLIEKLGTDEFYRFRLGVGRQTESVVDHEKRRDVTDHVLSAFHEHEAGEVRHLVERGVEALRLALSQGIDKAMNTYSA